MKRKLFIILLILALCNYLNLFAYEKKVVSYSNANQEIMMSEEIPNNAHIYSGGVEYHILDVLFNYENNFLLFIDDDVRQHIKIDWLLPRNRPGKIGDTIKPYNYCSDHGHLYAVYACDWEHATGIRMRISPNNCLDFLSFSLLDYKTFSKEDKKKLRSKFDLTKKTFFVRVLLKKKEFEEYCKLQKEVKEQQDAENEVFLKNFLSKGCFKTVDEYILWKKRTRPYNLNAYLGRYDDSEYIPLQKGDIFQVQALEDPLKIIEMNKHGNGFLYLVCTRAGKGFPCYIYSNEILKTYTDSLGVYGYGNSVFLDISKQDFFEFLGDQEVFENFTPRPTGLFQLITRDSPKFDIYWESLGKYTSRMDLILKMNPNMIYIDSTEKNDKKR